MIPLSIYLIFFSLWSNYTDMRKEENDMYMFLNMWIVVILVIGSMYLLYFEFV